MIVFPRKGLFIFKNIFLILNALKLSVRSFVNIRKLVLSDVFKMIRTVYLH